MGKRSIFTGLVLSAVTGLLGQPPSLLSAEPAEESAAGTGEGTAFPMREVSILGDSLNQAILGELTRGARAETQDEPYDEVEAYPKLDSTKPIYGMIRLDADPYEKESGTPRYFVIDESGENAAKEAPAEENPEENPSLLEKLGAAVGIKTAQKAPAPESPKLNNTYDRLYVDLDGDQETFTITVRYDTQELYGKVEAARKIIVRAE